MESVKNVSAQGTAIMATNSFWLEFWSKKYLKKVPELPGAFLFLILFYSNISLLYLILNPPLYSIH